MDSSNSSFAKHLAHAHEAYSWQGSSPALWTVSKTLPSIDRFISGKEKDVEMKRPWLIYGIPPVFAGKEAGQQVFGQA